MSEHPLLSVRDLRVSFETDDGRLRAVDGIDVTVDAGETVCLVGESGSGKTVACEAMTRLLRTPPGRIEAGELRFDGRDVLAMDASELRSLRGNRIAHVFQNPQGSLNHVYTVGWQIREAIQAHEEVSNASARRRAIDLLDRVGLPDPGNRIDDYPHELSGGQRQRVSIAMALAASPDLLIADEPTTSLDVTVQAQILELLRELQSSEELAVLFVTHDLGVVAEIADRVVVVYAGTVVERGSVYDVLERPSHPYTRALVECLPGRGRDVRSIGGRLPSAVDPPEGCRFAERCPHAVSECSTGDRPPIHAVPDSGDGHGVSCVHFGPDRDHRTVTEESDLADGSRDGGTS